jgi:hypothetical protein
MSFPLFRRLAPTGHETPQSADKLTFQSVRPGQSHPTPTTGGIHLVHALIAKNDKHLVPSRRAPLMVRSEGR